MLRIMTFASVVLAARGTKAINQFPSDDNKNLMITKAPAGMVVYQTGYAGNFLIRRKKAKPAEDFQQQDMNGVPGLSNIYWYSEEGHDKHRFILIVGSTLIKCLEVEKFGKRENRREYSGETISIGKHHGYKFLNEWILHDGSSTTQSILYFECAGSNEKLCMGIPQKTNMGYLLQLRKNKQYGFDPTRAFEADLRDDIEIIDAEIKEFENWRERQIKIEQQRKALRRKQRREATQARRLEKQLKRKKLEEKKRIEDELKKINNSPPKEESESALRRVSEPKFSKEEPSKTEESDDDSTDGSMTSMQSYGIVDQILSGARTLGERIADMLKLDDVHWPTDDSVSDDESTYDDDRSPTTMFDDTVIVDTIDGICG